MTAWLGTLDSLAATWAVSIGRASWQGGIALAAVWAVSAVLPKLPASVRCWLWRLAYLKLLVAFLWATPIDLPLLTGAPSPRWILPSPRAISATAPLVSAKNPPARDARPAALPTGSMTAPAVPNPAVSLLLLWLLGLGACITRSAFRWRRAQRVRQRCWSVADEALRGSLIELCQHFRLRQVPELLTTDLPTPWLVGGCPPAIGLPGDLLNQTSPLELRLMLAHELAHLKRHDLRWGWLPQLAEGLFFFHPVVWLVRREWHTTQEMACDEMALQVTQAPPATYGAMLLKVAARSPADLDATLVTLGAARSYGRLQRRLRAMQYRRPFSQKQLIIAGLAVAIIALAGVFPWRLTTRRIEGQLLRGSTMRVVSLAFSPDGKTIANAGPRGTGDETIDQVELWDAQTGTLKRVLRGYKYGVILTVAFLPNGDTIALVSQSGHGQKRVTLWNAVTGQFKDELELPGRTYHPFSAALSLDGRTLAISSHDTPGSKVAAIRLWDVQTGTLLRTLECGGDWVTCLTFSPNGQILAGVGQRPNRTNPLLAQGEMYLWEVSTGTLERTLTFTGQGPNGSGAAFSPDGKRLASVVGNGLVGLADVGTGQLLRTLAAPSSELNCIAFSPDSNLIASGDYDGTVRLWDTQTGKLLRTLAGHRAQVTAVAFSPDGRLVVSSSGSLYEALRLWRL